MRKISAHYIFDGKKFHKYGTLHLDDDNRVVDVLPQTEGEQAQVEFYNGIVCPGFVNAHCHLELSHLQGKISQHTGLPGFIAQIISNRNSDSNHIFGAMMQADLLMQQNGIVAVGDIANVADSFPVKEQSRIAYHTFIELFDSFSGHHEVFNTGKALFKTYCKQHRLSMSPHAPYSCSRQLISRIAVHSSEYEYPITIHNQEHESENELYQSKEGELFDFFTKRGVDFSTFNAFHKTSLQAIAPHFPKNRHVLFVHNTFTSHEDILLLKTLRPSDTYTFVVCPLSNKYIADRLPPFDMFIRDFVSVAIGTDSFASNNELSILSEMHCLQDAFPEIGLDILLRCATYNGAKALGMQRNVGSFGKGTMPGVLLLDNVDLHQMKLSPETKVRVLV